MVAGGGPCRVRRSLALEGGGAAQLGATRAASSWAPLAKARLPWPFPRAPRAAPSTVGSAVGWAWGCGSVLTVQEAWCHSLPRGRSSAPCSQGSTVLEFWEKSEAR